MQLHYALDSYSHISLFTKPLNDVIYSYSYNALFTKRLNDAIDSYSHIALFTKPLNDALDSNSHIALLTKPLNDAIDKYSHMHCYVYNAIKWSTWQYSRMALWERSGSVVECLTRDQRAAGSSLTDITALWSLNKTHLS